MDKNKILNFLSITLFITSIIVLICTFILYFNKDKNNIYIKIDDKTITSKLIEINALTIKPGDEYQYHLIIDFNNNSSYEINILFIDMNEENIKNYSLNQYLTLKIQNKEKTIYQNTISKISQEKELTFSCDITKRKNYILDIIYYMDENIGNEAQNLKTDFNIIITITKLEE